MLWVWDVVVYLQRRPTKGTLKTTTMNTLANRIENATSSQELELIVSEMPKQANGHRCELAGILADTFWYIDLDTVEKQKAFMMVRVNSGIFSTN